MTRRKDGRYQEKLTIKGKSHYFYGKTKAEVLRKIKDFEIKQENGELFETVAEQWWEEAETTLAHGSLKEYKPAKNRAITNFGDKFIKDITPSEISRKIKELSKIMAFKTVKNQLTVYNHIFRYAVDMGYITFNPARDIEVPQVKEKKKISSPPQTEIEIAKNSYDIEFGLFAYMALYTGLRRGELLALDWSDVDIENRIIKVDKAIVHKFNKPYVSKPKTSKSIGKVPILDALLKVLKPSKGLIFPNKNGEYMTQRQFECAWQRYCKATGISSTPHQFRHAYATMLFEANVPPEKMMILLRHAQLSTTMDVYTDIRDNKIKSVFEEIYKVNI